ncbi:hypothetical protein B0A50_06435 [Salinomyces thailandicus]|uniref:Uncharacterized protein n=1 Tax=Salinomyces thailandicus TaxID=706561 RepID=A0A4V5N3K1_9PEZI|nr:hypothetical protein B0A50_06435 [Salinomyces thailandica]
MSGNISNNFGNTPSSEQQLFRVQQQLAAAKRELADTEEELHLAKKQVDYEQRQLQKIRAETCIAAPVNRSRYYAYPASISTQDFANISRAIDQCNDTTLLLKKTTNKLDDHVRALRRLQGAPIAFTSGNDVYAAYGAIEGGARRAFSFAAEAEAIAEEMEVNFGEQLSRIPTGGAQ